MVLGHIGRFFLFVAGGIAVIIVGFFMLRGNMRMWDRPRDYEGESDDADDGRGDDDADGSDSNNTRSS